jgi:hypothetical protein
MAYFGHATFFTQGGLQNPIENIKRSFLTGRGLGYMLGDYRQLNSRRGSGLFTAGSHADTTGNLNSRVIGRNPDVEVSGWRRSRSIVVGSALQSIFRISFRRNVRL